MTSCNGGSWSRAHAPDRVWHVSPLSLLVQSLVYAEVVILDVLLII